MASEELNRALLSMREDYTRVRGRSFRHFFCPILLKDEDTDLCLGHVVPAALPNSCRKTVVQRADVDNFYGSVAEADFGALIQVQQKGLSGVVSDHRLSNRLNARILVGGEECRFYTFAGHKAAHHSRFTLEQESGGHIAQLVLVKRPEELMANQERHWYLEVEADFRMSAMITMIKAAYLSLFRMLGFRYALTASGICVGRDILGKFYEENRGKPQSDIRKASIAFFRPYRHMFRPGVACGAGTPRGTVEDGRAGVCFGSSGHPWAVVVWVRVDEALHAVLMPDIGHPDSAATWWGFLNSDSEEFSVSEAKFDHANGRWEVSSKPSRAVWPKAGGSFVFE